MTRFILYTFVLIGFFICGSAFAQQDIESYRKELPKFDAMPDDEFMKQTSVFQEVPFGDEFLSYKIRLAENWEQYENQSIGGLSLSKKVLGEIARYYGPARLMPRSFLTIEALALDHQLTAEQWYIQYLLANGYPSQGIKVYGTQRVEGLYVKLEKDVTYLVRSVVVINGKRAIFVEYALPADAWADERAMQAKVVQSFELLNKDDSLPEDMQTHQFLDVGEFKYPASWELRASTVRSVDRMDVDLLSAVPIGEGRNRTQILNGRMIVQMLSGYIVEDLEQEVENFKRDFEKDGLAIGALIEEPEDFVFSDSVEFGFVEVYKVSDISKPQMQYEYWLSIIAAEDYYYLVSLLTPSRNQDFFNWSKNTQAFRLVNRYIRPQKN